MREHPRPQKARSSLTLGSSRHRRPWSYIHVTVRGWRGARLGQCWMKCALRSFFSAPLGSCLILLQGLLGRRHHREAKRISANGSLGFSANCSFQQDKGTQMWETIKFFPMPPNRWLSSKKLFFCEGRKRIHLCYLGSALMLLRLKWTIIQVIFTKEQMEHCTEELLM